MADHDPSNPQHTKRARVADQNRAEQLDADMRWVMSDPRGRRVVAMLIERAGVRVANYNADPLLLSRIEGQRDIGIALRDCAERVAPEDYDTLRREERGRDD